MNLKATALVVTLLFAAGAAHSADRYIRQGATGAGNGSDWTNAFTDLPTSWVRGDTYWIADGTYSARTLNTPVNGTAVITIKKATAASHGTSTGWSAAFGDGQAVINGAVVITTSYWTFDGTSRNENNWKDGPS